MKLGIFTDSHYSSQEITCGNRYNSKSLQKIKMAYAFFESQKCDLVVFVSAGHNIVLQRSCKHHFEHSENIAVREADTKQSCDKSQTVLCFV